MLAPAVSRSRAKRARGPGGAAAEHPEGWTEGPTREAAAEHPEGWRPLRPEAHLLGFERMLANAVGFRQDEDGAWVVELSCGHCQHVRHNPPWQLREWTTTEAGRNDKLGESFDCPYCDMAVVPEDAKPYKQTPTFTEDTVPSGLLHDHRTKVGTWAYVVVEEGKLEYTCDRGTFCLKPGARGVVEPGVPHHVRLMGPVRFTSCSCARVLDRA